MSKISLKKSNNFLKFLTSIKNLFLISTLNIDNAFYSENKSYQKFSISIINLVLKITNKDIYYISSDIDDKIHNKKIKNIYIGDGIVRNIFFLVIKAKNLFLTLTDLDNHFLKKTKKIEKYIYFFHSPISTFKSYTVSAFDNYDIILCNGNYQKKEIKFRESKTGLKKELVEFGYIYFNYLKQIFKDNKFLDCNEILIAPSWNLNEENFISEKIIHLIDKLLSMKTYKIRFRPHPEHFKRSKPVLEAIKEKFKNQDFIFDNDSIPLQALKNAKYLITDKSGIAIEYLLIFKKPVIYYETKDKVHNQKIEHFSDFTAIEDQIKTKFGLTLDIDNLDNFDEKIKIFNKKFENLGSDVDYFLRDNFYNIEKNEDVFEEKLKHIIN